MVMATPGGGAGLCTPPHTQSSFLLLFLIYSPGPLSFLTGHIYVYLRVSIAVKRHHDHGKSYKRKYLVGA